ncbi:hypothetical protein ABH926_010105 [Catenulispora sp. GP43]|uniref:hypothetical protein n=1 Tax=Catenulispora sp. GP43 TaxID=3156263 RepID=UPI0035168595
MAALSEAVENTERLDDEDLLERLVVEIRTTPLDTSRTAIDLLEDLLTGIYACALLYRAYESDIEDEETFDGQKLRPPQAFPSLIPLRCWAELFPDSPATLLALASPTRQAERRRLGCRGRPTRRGSAVSGVVVMPSHR